MAKIKINGKMIEKRLILILFLAMIIIQCEDNTDSQDSSNNCGIETTYIKDVDNIDNLGNASGSTIRMVDDCSYVGVGHRAGVPWITKFNELGEQVWDKKFDEIPIPQGNYGTRSEERRVGHECRSRWSTSH
mgnify:CR=1 FL=1